MGVFHSRNDLLVRTSDGRNVVLQEPLEYVTDAGIHFRAPPGSTSDGASTPQIGWDALPPFGTYWLAAVLHDAAYRGTLEQETVDGQWLKPMLSKAECDDLLLEAMSSLGVPQLTKETIYDGVRIGGWKSFEKDRGYGDEQPDSA